MIQITLSFKSATFASQALREIPESWLVGGLPAAETPEVVAQPAKKSNPKPTPAATVTEPVAPGQPTAEAVAETAAPAKTADASTPTAQSAEEKPQPSTAVEYPVLQKAVFTLAGKSREAAAAVAATFGVKTFKELANEIKEGDKVVGLAEKEPGLFAKALAAVQAKTAELG